MLTASLILLLLILINGLFAAVEISMVSARRPRLEAAAEDGDAGARAALKLRKEPNRFLSTVQIGITLIGIVSGAFGEAAIADPLAKLLARDPRLAANADLLSTIIVVALITYLALLLGELVPKRIGLALPETIATTFARPMRLLSQAAAPLVWFLSASTDLLLRPFGKHLSEQHAVTEDDIRGMIEQAAESGAVHEEEQEIVERVFEVGDLRVRSLMVPRPEVEYLDVDETPERIRIAVATAVHSHFPVCRGGLEHIIGIVHLKDIIKLGLVSESIDLEALSRPALFVPETMPVLKLLDHFRERDRRIALVVDEYGGFEGLITLNDVASAIIGKTAGDHPAEPMEVRRHDGSWLLDGSLPVARLRELLEVDELPGPQGDYETLAGYVLATLGHIPQIGEQFTAGQHKFEVIDKDGQRIDRVLVVPPPPAAVAEEE
jgi:putative hemolysin